MNNKNKTVEETKIKYNKCILARNWATGVSNIGQDSPESL